MRFQRALSTADCVSADTAASASRNRWGAKTRPSMDAKQQFGRAVDLYCAGQYGEALAIFDALQAEFPDSIEIERANDRFSLNKHQLGDKGIQITEGSIRRDGNSVDLESEVVALAETDLHYRMLSEMTGRYFSGLKSVIREGR